MGNTPPPTALAVTDATRITKVTSGVVVAVVEWWSFHRHYGVNASCGGRTDINDEEMTVRRRLYDYVTSWKLSMSGVISQPISVPGETHNPPWDRCPPAASSWYIYISLTRTTTTVKTTTIIKQQHVLVLVWEATPLLFSLSKHLTAASSDLRKTS